MNLIYTKSYDKTLKDLKKKHNELKELNRIIDYLFDVKNFKQMINDPIAKMYGFERLRYFNSELYSFRISKVIRLIVMPKDNDIEIYLLYISTKHYEDFNEGKVILND